MGALAALFARRAKELLTRTGSLTWERWRPAGIFARRAKELLTRSGSFTWERWRPAGIFAPSRRQFPG